MSSQDKTLFALSLAPGIQSVRGELAKALEVPEQGAVPGVAGWPTAAKMYQQSVRVRLREGTTHQLFHFCVRGRGCVSRAAIVPPSPLPSSGQTNKHSPLVTAFQDKPQLLTLIGQESICLRQGRNVLEPWTGNRKHEGALVRPREILRAIAHNVVCLIAVNNGHSFLH